MKCPPNLYWNRSCTFATILLTCSWLVSQTAWAAERVYNIVTDQSNMAVSGNLVTPLGTAPLQQQGPGSLTTSYSGTIRADRSAGSIQFLFGSVIDASVSGKWRPLADASAGFAPADYGGHASLIGLTADLAARDVVADLNSEVLPLSSEGNFNLSTVLLSFISGSIASRSTLAAGVGSLVGQSSGNGMGSLVSTPDTEVLTIPINSTFSTPVATATTLNLTFTGQLVATAMLPLLPGDYNQNGTVDAADYTIWRDTLGSTTDLRANGDNTGASANVIDLADFTFWKTHFGVPAGNGSGGGANAAIPEPATLAMLLVGMLAMFPRRRGKVS